MKPLKVQVEIRYSPIIRFFDIYKKVANAHLRVATNYFVNDQGTFDENLSIIYQDEGVVINLRSNLIAFVIDDKPDNLFETSGPLYHFLGLFEKISALDEFVGVQGIMISEWTLFEIDKPYEGIVKNFQAKNMSTTSGLTINDSKPNDIAISLTYNNAKDSFRVHCGPYNIKLDIQSHSLQSPRRNANYYEELKGVLSQLIIFESTQQCDLNMLKRLDKKITTFTRQLKENVI